MNDLDPSHVDSLAAFVQRMVDVSGDPVGFDARAWTVAWLHEPMPALGGARALDYMATGEGRAIVEFLLRQVQSGAYS